MIIWEEVTRVKTWIGRAEETDAVFRVTGRPVPGTSSYTYRVDMRTIGPWEVIDQGVPFSTELEAQQWSLEYLQAMEEQNTVEPKMRSRN